MIKQLLLVFLLIISIGMTGCTSKPESIEYEIINVRMIENTETEELYKYNFDVTYINLDGYIKFASTSYVRDNDNIIRLKQSDKDEYKFFWTGKIIIGDSFELYVPKNITKIL